MTEGEEHVDGIRKAMAIWSLVIGQCTDHRSYSAPKNFKSRGVRNHRSTTMGRVETNAQVRFLALETDLKVSHLLIGCPQKRKRQSEAKAAPATTIPKSTPTVDTSKPTAVFQPTKGRSWTVSVALPGSIIAKYVLPLSWKYGNTTDKPKLPNP